MNLNSDLGEAAGHDEEILPQIDSANVCCGAHAGSPEVTAATVRRCLELGVEVGAHPGYADRANFGQPVSNLNSTTFGQIQTAGDPRIVQFALRYRF